jgi:hypothetical protein
MSAKVTSICCTLALIAACSGGAGQATNLRGGPDGIPKSSTDSPGNGGYDPPGNSNQDGPGNSNQDSPGGSSTSDSSCLSCIGVYSCTVPGENGTSLIGLAPGTNGCNVIETQGGSAEGALICGGAVVTTGNSSSIVETWTGGSGGFTLTATEDGQTITITCVATSQSLPTSTTVTGGGTNGVDAG